VGTRGSSLGVKRPVREANHSLQSSAEVKEWVGPCLHFPNTPSWHGAQFKHKVKWGGHSIQVALLPLMKIIITP